AGGGGRGGGHGSEAPDERDRAGIGAACGPKTRAPDAPGADRRPGSGRNRRVGGSVGNRDGGFCVRAGSATIPPMARAVAVRTAGSAAAALALGGCMPSEKEGFDAAGPSKRLDAIVRASEPGSDPRSLARLVEQLDSQDPAARMLAIRA